MRNVVLRTLLAVAGVCSLVANRQADAAVPTATQVMGAMSSVGGGPVADGVLNVTFALYAKADAQAPVWTEGPVPVAVKSGQFAWSLGSIKPLDAGVLASAGENPWLGLKVENDPELPRRPLLATPFAMIAGTAQAIDCSGCIGADQLAPEVLAGYAKSGSLAKVATTGAYADLQGTPDLSPFAKIGQLAKVATSGSYADLAGLPDLAVFAKAGDLAKVAGTGAYDDLTGKPDLAVYAKNENLAAVAYTGKYADLNGAPTLPKLGTACGTGLVVQGLNADGTLKCVNGGGKITPDMLPPDGIDEVSNGLIFDQFTDTANGTANNPIKDNNPTGTSDLITFPDIGIAQALTVNVDITNSKTETLVLTVYDPNNVAYVLCGGKDSQGNANPTCGSGGTFKGAFPAPIKTAAGDLTSWVGKNPAGKWYLNVIDTDFKNNATDGQVNSWSISMQTISNKKVQVKGNLIVDGTITAGGILGPNGVPLAPKLNYVQATVSGPHTSNSGGGWAQLDTNLTVTLDKQQDISALRIQVMTGALETHSSWGWGGIEVRMDGATIKTPWGCGSEYYGYSDQVRADTISCLATNVTKGKHVFTVWWNHMILEDVGQYASDGRHTAHATLFVEELQ